VLNDSAVRRATRAGSEAAQLAQAADWVLARLEPAEEVGRLLAAALDGFQISLHRGEPHESIHQAYHRFWLTLLK
jgi:hypothetical protein